MKNQLKQDQFELLRKIQRSPNFSQRAMANDLGFSLGKLNYCLKELKNKGLIKIRNFKKKENKITHLRYLVTPKGITLRTKLTLDFMKRKMREYEQLKRELDDVGNSQN